MAQSKKKNRIDCHFCRWYYSVSCSAHICIYRWTAKNSCNLSASYYSTFNLEYTPSDTTDAYLKQDSHLKSSVAIETDNIRFDFFEFDNDNSASNVYTHAYKQILDYRNGYIEDVETEEYYSNYRLYSLKTTGMYYLTIWVDNTAIYAYCNEDYISELGEILTAIGYQS